MPQAPRFRALVLLVYSAGCAAAGTVAPDQDAAPNHGSSGGNSGTDVGRPDMDARGNAAGGGDSAGSGESSVASSSDAGDAAPSADAAPSLIDASGVSGNVRLCGSTGACLGIFYSTWHCPALSPVHDLFKILAGTEQPGPVTSWHWWGQPALGFYCLSQNDAALKTHAEMLRDAGIDFIFVDVTNQPNQSGSEAMIQKPFGRLLEIWKDIPGAPKVVPWVYLKVGSDMIDYMVTSLRNYPGLSFPYQGKPLIIVRPQDLDTTRVSTLSSSFTFRQMWGLMASSAPAEPWSFLQSCQSGFRESQGTIACNQRSATVGGKLEQVTIGAAYQATYMSETSTATPKFGGNTLRRQFATLFQHPDVPIATITGFNEWMAQRYCNAGTPADCTLDQSFFVDEYDHEYSRDIEPGGPDGDFYYRLMSSCIRVYRHALDCATATSELCCQ